MKLFQTDNQAHKNIWGQTFTIYVYTFTFVVKITTMEKLPEKWAVERTPENYQQVNEWANANLIHGPYFNDYGLVSSDVYNCNEKHELLTSAQFMQLVYNTWKHAQNSDGWVKCSERLPEENRLYLTFFDGRIDVQYYKSESKRFSHPYLYTITTTHWRELPAPPIN